MPQLPKAYPITPLKNWLCGLLAAALFVGCRKEPVATVTDAAHRCFLPFSADPIEYAHAVPNSSANSRTQVERRRKGVQSRTGTNSARADTAFLLQQNALVACNAGRCYSTATSSQGLSWNIRDAPMLETLGCLLDRHGPSTGSFSPVTCVVRAGTNRSGTGAIGVTYNAASEGTNHVTTVLPKRYEAFLYFDRTKPLTPLGTSPRNGPPDTYPSGY